MSSVARSVATLQLSIEVDSEPISGSVSSGAHGAESFNGWIELAAAIEAARIAAPDGGGLGGTGVKTLGRIPGANGSEL